MNDPTITVIMNPVLLCCLIFGAAVWIIAGLMMWVRLAGEIKLTDLEIDEARARIERDAKVMPIPLAPPKPAPIRYLNVHITEGKKKR